MGKHITSHQIAEVTATAHLRMGDLIDSILAKMTTFDSVNSNIRALVARKKAAG